MSSLARNGRRIAASSRTGSAQRPVRVPADLAVDGADVHRTVGTVVEKVPSTA
jgi:hypothetical protein